MLTSWEFLFSVFNGTCFWILVAEITVDKALGIALFCRTMTLYTLSLITFDTIEAIGAANWFYLWGFFQLFVAIFNFIFMRETSGLSTPEKKVLYRPKAALKRIREATVRIR
jgi:hypothetical protein